MAFGPILNYRENFKNKDAKWCMLAVFETIWNLRHTFENKDDKWSILTGFGTADTILKTRTLNGASFETIWNCRHTFENKDAKWCIKFLRHLIRYGTSEDILKTKLFLIVHIYI